MATGTGLAQNFTPPVDSPTVYPPPSERDALERIGDEIATIAAHITAATYRLLVLLAEFDQRDGWGSGGFVSCAHWLSWRTGLDLGAAREKVRVARALTELPLIADSMRRGQLSYSKVRALSRVATPANEADLLGFANAATAAHVEKVVRAWRAVDRQEELERVNSRHAGRKLEYWYDDDGSLVIRARLDPEAGAVVVRALEAAAEVEDAPRSTADDPVDPPSWAQSRADALLRVAEAALGSGLDEPRTGDRYQVVVHVDGEALADGATGGQVVLDNGIGISAETSRRLACDSSRVSMTHSRDGTTIDVGRKTRTIPPSIRRALEHRDHGCRFPGCTSRHCDAHHVRHWADGGETRLNNLLLLCRRHHRAVHEDGFAVELLARGEARFVTPGGRSLPGCPRTSLSGDPVHDLESAHRDAGLRIDAETALSSWDGRRLDLSWAVDGFRGLTAAMSVSAVESEAPAH